MSKVKGLLLVLFLGACVGPAKKYEITPNANTLLSKMTAVEAERVLKKYVRAGESRGGLCIRDGSVYRGLLAGHTKLNQAIPVVVSGSKVLLPLNARVKGETTTSIGYPYDTKTTEYMISDGIYVFDIKDLEQVRITQFDGEDGRRARRWNCDHSAGYRVSLSSKVPLPNGANPLLNVVAQHDLDLVMAAIKYHSPEARIIVGAGK